MALLTGVRLSVWHSVWSTASCGDRWDRWMDGWREGWTDGMEIHMNE